MTSEQIAEALLAARRERLPLPSPCFFAPADEAAGYDAQRALAGLMGAMPPAGFKIGAIAPRMQEYLGVYAPIAGFVPADGLGASGTRFRFADYVAPGVECEIGLRLGRDLPPGPISLEEAAAAVDELFPAIELVDNRYADFATIGGPLLAADQMFNAGGVTGAPVPEWAQLDLASIRGSISIDGVQQDEGQGSALLGHPLKVLCWLADSGVAHAFGGLKAGQVVFLGSVTPPIWVDGPCTATVAFEGLGEVSLYLV